MTGRATRRATAGSVLVTGAGSGIGLATSVHLASRGFHTIGAVREASGLTEVSDAAERAGVEIEPVVLDVTDLDACDRFVGATELFGLVNNAGFYNVGAVEDVPIDEARHQLETMVLGPMHLARAVLPGMRARGGGRIVNVTTSMNHLSLALTGWYQASNQALAAVGDALRMEVAASGIEVVTIEPGAIETRIWRKAEADLHRRRPGSSYAPSYDRALRILHALDGRIHPPEMVARVVGQALTERHPRVRYQAGREVFLLRAAGVVIPRRVRDLVVRAALRL